VGYKFGKRGEELEEPVKSGEEEENQLKVSGARLVLKRHVLTEYEVCGLCAVEGRR